MKFNAAIDKPLATGTYTATSTVAKTDGTILDKKSTTFEVGTAYAPTSGVSAVQGVVTQGVGTQGVATQGVATQGVANIVMNPMQTSAPGPDPLVICGLLALGVFIAGLRKQK